MRAVTVCTACVATAGLRCEDSDPYTLYATEPIALVRNEENADMVIGDAYAVTLELIEASS